MFYLIPLSIGIVLLGVFLYFRVKEKRVHALMLKGLTSLMFIATALVAWLTSKNSTSYYGLFVIAGLFFGLLGDVFLDLKYIVLPKEKMYTILGFCAFGIGHIFFTTGLFLHFFDFTRSVLFIIIPVIVAALFVVISLLMEVFSKIRYKDMKPFVIGYGLILFFTVAMYFSAAIQGSWQVVPVVIMAVGLVLFALSDLILNNTYFAPGFNTPGFVISNHIFYYVAQFTIAVSLFFLF